MIFRYEYKSACCGHGYIEQRNESEDMYNPTCVVCGNADYQIVNQTEVPA